MTSPEGAEGPGPRIHSGLSARDHRMIRVFFKPGNESRRLFRVVLGTFLLVVAAAGADIVNVESHGVIGHTATVVAPALLVGILSWPDCGPSRSAAPP